MKISEIMTRDVKACRAEQTLDVPAQIMWDADCGCVPVVDDDQRVVGMVTDRDICMAAHFQGTSPSRLPVSGAMSRSVVACHQDDSLESAMELMQKHQIRRLPVLGANKRLVGILSINDLARNLASHGPLALGSKGAAAIEATMAAVGQTRTSKKQRPASPPH
jgi:CBS domain-containing protein